MAVPSSTRSAFRVTARASRWSPDERDARLQLARRWRATRARYFALPVHIRRALKIEWQRSGGRKDPADLSAAIWRHAAVHGAAPEDFPHLSASIRRHLTADLNDRARRDDPWTRCTRAFSPGALKWLCPAWVAQEDSAPQLAQDHCPDLYRELWRAIAEYDSFGPASDPFGERRSGTVTVQGQAFRFELLYRRPGCGQVGPTPWNADLTRRVLWVRLADEHASYSEEVEDLA